jgi:IMP cyclohydrolase
LAGSYRVSSRSFPNRTANVGESAVAIVPKEGHERDVFKNPYIAYNCVRIVADHQVAVVTNGAQTDPVAEKIEAGMGPRDALILSLTTLDYEKDQYDTPRIAGVLDRRDDSLWLGVVRRDGAQAERVELGAGAFQYVATYEENRVVRGQGGDYPPKSPEEACAFVLRGGVFAEREHPVTAVAALARPAGFSLYARDAAPTG